MEESIDRFVKSGQHFQPALEQTKRANAREVFVIAPNGNLYAFTFVQFGDEQLDSASLPDDSAGFPF